MASRRFHFHLGDSFLSASKRTGTVWNEGKLSFITALLFKKTFYTFPEPRHCLQIPSAHNVLLTLAMLSQSNLQFQVLQNPSHSKIKHQTGAEFMNSKSIHQGFVFIFPVDSRRMTQLQRRSFVFNKRLNVHNFYTA